MTPSMNRSGIKAAISERLIEMTVKPICRAPAARPRDGPCRVDVPMDVLDHDDRVVDDKADRDRMAIRDRLSR